MDRSEDGAREQLLTDLVAAGPSTEAWTAIYNLFAAWPENDSKQRHLDRATELLEAWDDRLRFAYSSNGFLYDGARLSSLARLLRSVEIYRREDRGAAELSAIASSEYAAGLTSLTIVHSDV